MLRSFPAVNITDGCGSDHFILSADRRTLTLTNFTDVHYDNYRVIVQSELTTEIKTISTEKAVLSFENSDIGAFQVFEILDGRMGRNSKSAQSLLQR